MMQDFSEDQLRAQIVETMQLLVMRGLNRGTTGNVSARCGEGILVTPSGVVPEKLTPDAIVYLDREGAPRAGSFKPSSEWRMHFDILASRADACAVVHCHSRHATILACAGKSIPPMHYMVGVSGKPTLPLAPYATFGTAELAANVVATLQGGNACLMANHGLIALAPTLSRALLIAEEMEEQSAVYWGTLAIGGPTVLSGAQMDENFRQFGNYGQKK